MRDLFLAVLPRNAAGPITLTQMSAVRGYLGNTLTGFPVAIGHSSVWVQDGDHWQRYPNDGWPHSHLFVYGSDAQGGVIATSTKALRRSWRNDFLSYESLPAVPANVTLAMQATGFTDAFGMPTQPASLGNQDAWIVTTGTNVDTFIKRSKFVNGAWQAWADYPTAPFTDFDNPPILPWQIADAEGFWVPAKRGNLIGIGDNFHLVSYHAP